MANTYTQIFLHIIFAVKGRKSLLSKDWRQDVFRYMNGVAKKRGCKPIQINGVEDHVHALISLNPAVAPSDLVRDIKSQSSLYIHKQGYLSEEFEWQVGYAAFSYQKSKISVVARYISNQEEHHRKKTFRDEYVHMISLGDEPVTKYHEFEWIDLTPEDQ